MDISIISQRYAKALFDLSIEMGKLESVKKDIDLIQSVISENADFRRLLESPVIPVGKKNKILTRIFDKHLDELTIRFLLLVARKEREIFLQHIVNAFVKFYKEHHNIITIKLSSCEKLDEKSKNVLLALLVKKTHKKIDLIEVIDTSLIGGFMLTMDDQKYDASMKHQLEKLRKTFEKNLYIKGF